MPNFKPSTWTKEINGKQQTRDALTPSEEVFYQFEGWRRVDTKAATKAPGDSKTDNKADTKTDSKPASRP